MPWPVSTQVHIRALYPCRMFTCTQTLGSIGPQTPYGVVSWRSGSIFASYA